ncbi:MAG: AMP-binding protein [Acidobacteria bacterium]|nr:AMP-binding protein [Acidobacteriota bacterium]
MSEQFAWQPDESTRKRAQLTRFLRQCGLDSFDALYERSITDVAWFTEELLRFLDLQFDRHYEKILDLSRGPAWPEWCTGGRLNIARNCLDRHLQTAAAQPAIIWEGEEGTTRTLTYSELHSEVECIAAGLRMLGIGKGDAAGIHLPMIPETAAALLALARIGAIAVPLFSGYGPAAIEARLRDVGAKALFTCDAFPRRGSAVPAKRTADEALAHCPEVKHVIVVDRAGQPVNMQPERDLGWEQLKRLGENADAALHAPESTSAEDLLIVLYTSGTTGRPKGIQHTHCGFPVKSAQDMAFGTDVGAGTRISWVTDIGWMMGPWLIYGATLLGATMVLYDGAPDFPAPDRLWSFCVAHNVEVLGVSPTLIRALSAHGDELPAKYDLTHLRIFGSTGEPWNPEPWRWLFENVGRSRIPIINYSGGTEISGGILMGNPLLPIKPCSFPAPCPGIAADVVDDEFRSVRGSVGELVIRSPWIGQARGFWNDRQRYLETYWARRPDIWVHGDWAQVDPDGHWYILGRSDDTLKIAGKRVGPAEVESILVEHPMVVEAAVIGIPDEVKGSAMIAFCVASESSQATDGLAEELRARIGAQLGKPLRPERVHFVRAIPKTRNGKVMRRVIRAAYLDEDPGDLTALENPATVNMIAEHGIRRK